MKYFKITKIRAFTFECIWILLFPFLYAIFHTEQSRQRKPGNLVLRGTVPIKIISFPIFHTILEVFEVEELNAALYLGARAKKRK